MKSSRTGAFMMDSVARSPVPRTLAYTCCRLGELARARTADRSLQRIAAVVLSCAVTTLAPRLGLAQASLAQQATIVVQQVTIAAAPALGAVRIDGRLDEPSWTSASPVAGFSQASPTPGAPASERTEVRVLIADNALYVGVRAFDSRPDSIAAQLARRDASGIYSDWIHVYVDSYHDRRTAFRFSVNPRGVQSDGILTDDTRENANWDAVWTAASVIDSEGWTAEFRIPLSQLRFTGREGSAWGFQVQREIARRQERDTWSPWTQSDPAFVSRFGELRGTTHVSPPSRLELLPYVSTKLRKAPTEVGNPLFVGTSTRLAVGADMSVGLPKGLTLTATVNPDFGQVEVDPAVVNLTAFETFYPEKRPFFVEGSDVFAFGQVRANNDYSFQQFFYSRRVGRSPQVRPSGPLITYVDVPTQSTILGAVKISGKSGPWTVGLMDAITRREDALFVNRDGSRGSAMAEPLTNYGAARVRRELNSGRTVIGALATTSTRSLGGGQLAPVLRSQSTLGGVDFEHGWKARTWILSGFLAGSSVSGNSEALRLTQRSSVRYYQRPDATHLALDSNRTRLTGHIAELALAKAGNVYASIAVKESSPGLEMNDLGFQARTDYRSLALAAGYQRNTLGKMFRSYVLYSGSIDVYNLGRDPLYKTRYAGASGTFLNFWNASLTAYHNPATSDDRQTRGGPRIAVPRAEEINVSLGTDTRRVVGLSGSGGYATDAANGSSQSLRVSADVRPSAQVRLSVGPNWNATHTASQYVSTVPDGTAQATFGNRYVFADLRQKTLAMDVRLDLTFSTRTSLQLYAQPFISSGQYSHFKELREGGTRDFMTYGVDRGSISTTPGGYTVDPDAGGPAREFTIANPGFNVRSLRGNAVLRWEYAPGSTLFLVWQQTRSGDVGDSAFSLGRDVSGIFKTPASNTLLVKATYWLGR